MSITPIERIELISTGEESKLSMNLFIGFLKKQLRSLRLSD
ncbi:hypothetical protein GXM_00531 [Nostoc sphaeroides CCNUC1]|uniref:Uncharacterized protein n=1 Tax=Nostoc sphaeroides CCNUC1 TaxID=2653204 RepID=A0A5P8VRI0_9NOSO|nr:hypothetical protein GXM_00531 [Nostoc sphaeroides CCNUC1]